MSFLDKLFWGASKRFANDVTNGVIKERNHQSDEQIKNKINTFNTVSQDYYTKVNFIRDIWQSFEWFENNSLEGKSNRETINRFRKYYDTYVYQVKSRPELPITGNALEIYNEGLRALEVAVQNIEWVLMKWLLDELKKEYEQLELSEEEYDERVDEVMGAYRFRKNDNRQIYKIKDRIHQEQNVFLQSGERVLAMLK